MLQELHAGEHTRCLALGLHEVSAQHHVDMADGEDDDEPGHDMMNPVRHHLTAEQHIHPAEKRSADIAGLRHVVHREAREDLDEHHDVEARI